MVSGLLLWVKSPGQVIFSRCCTSVRLDTLCAEQGPPYGSKQSGSKAAPSRVLLQPLPVVGTLQRAFAQVLAVGLVRSRSELFKSHMREAC